MKSALILAGIALCAVTAFGQQLKPNAARENNPYYSNTDTTHLDVSNAEWKKILPAELYRVARQQGTERPSTGQHWNIDIRGTYY